MSDSVLQRLGKGEMAAMQECIEQYGGLIWSLARRLCGAAAEAEDAVQEVFLSLWESAGRFDPEKGSEVTFVATIARRRLIDRRRSLERKRKQTEILKQQDKDAESSRPDRSMLAEDAHRAREAFEELSHHQQRVLRLAIHGGYTHEQIAQITDLPLGSVKTHARRGLIKVRDLLKERSTVAAETDS